MLRVFAYYLVETTDYNNLRWQFDKEIRLPAKRRRYKKDGVSFPLSFNLFLKRKVATPVSIQKQCFKFYRMLNLCLEGVFVPRLTFSHAEIRACRRNKK